MAIGPTLLVLSFSEDSGFSLLDHLLNSLTYTFLQIPGGILDASYYMSYSDPRQKTHSREWNLSASQ